MVYYLLSILAELENLTDLQPRGGCDDPTYPYYFKFRQVKCESCGEISRKETCVMISEEVPLPTGRGTANLVQKCKLCGREGNIQMITGQAQPLTLEQSQNEEFAKLMIFDSRGFELTGFSFADGWKAQWQAQLLTSIYLMGTLQSMMSRRNVQLEYPMCEPNLAWLRSRNGVVEKMFISEILVTWYFSGLCKM